LRPALLVCPPGTGHEVDPALWAKLPVLLVLPAATWLRVTYLSMLVFLALIVSAVWLMLLRGSSRWVPGIPVLLGVLLGRVGVARRVWRA
jgi:hypothetical protein